MANEQLFELARRTFDTPGFRDIEFIEVQAKSVINKVPAASRMPFDYTINPYRGCSHACVYCVVGDTPVLMADGTTRPIAKIAVGDRVYGTHVRGPHRRCIPTDVLAHWETRKPGFLVTLEDGTELVASGDHRFLSDRGWKHVTGAEHGPNRRPSLTTDDRLIGVDGPALTPDAQLRVVAVEPLGLDLLMFDITTGTGDFIANGVVSHNCFARPTHTFLDMNAGRDFESKIVVKVNAPEVLRRELAKRSWKGDHIAMGTNTDPYQHAEGRYRLMRGIIEALRDARNPFSILTKGTLILRDVDLLVEAAEHAEVSAAFSIGTLDEGVWRETEPGTPSPRARVDALRQLVAAGIPTGVLIAPILPGISDRPEQLRAVVEAVLDAGASYASPIMLHLRPGVREEFMPWLEREHPELVHRYERLYRSAYGSKTEREALSDRVRGSVQQHGGPRRPAAHRFRTTRRADGAEAAEQQRLW
jgi:DNA repair photolyase